MSNISEIDQSEFDNVPASVPLTLHEPVEPIEDVPEPAVIETLEEEPIVETVDITEPLADVANDIESAIETVADSVESAVQSVVEPIVAAVSDASHAVADAIHDEPAIEVVHAVDSQEARNARLLAEEEAEDRQDEVEEINTELAAAQLAERKKKQQEALLAAIQQALAGTSGQSMEMFGLGGDEYDDYEDDEQNEPEPPADTSMFAWLKSNLLPAAPISSYFTRRSLERYARLYSLKAGRFAWNIGTASLLVLVPYIIAHANELAFVDQFRETNRLQDLLNDAHSKGYEGHHSAPMAAAGQPQLQQAHVASKAPPGYVPPPVSVAAIPQQ